MAEGMVMGDLVSRLRAAAKAAHGKNEGIGSGVWSESAACNDLAADELEKLSDPVAVHANMQAGAIAKPILDDVLRLYPELKANMETLTLQRDAELQRANRLAAFIRERGLTVEYYAWDEEGSLTEAGQD
jgi:hypothetical protein